MPRLQCKNFETPDEVRTFPSGCVEIIQLDEIAIGRMRLQPGWRWSKDVAPVVCTPSCQNRHIGYAMSGTLEVTMDDGTRLIIRAGEGYEIPPGHDVHVLGDEPWESVEFASAHTFGLAPEQLGDRVLATVLFSDIVGLPLAWCAPSCHLQGPATGKGEARDRLHQRRRRGSSADACRAVLS
jgi:hypothetical protein